MSGATPLEPLEFFAQKRRRRTPTCHDAVTELVAKGQLRAAMSLCHDALTESGPCDGTGKTGKMGTSGAAADLWYLLGLIHDIAHEHEDMARCMRKAHGRSKGLEERA